MSNPLPIAIVGSVPNLSVDAVMSPYIYVFYSAFVVSYVFTPIMRQVALAYGIIDAPDLKRKLHAAPVAYLGGVAVFLGWMAGLATSQFVGVHRTDTPLTHLHLPIHVVVAAVLVVLLGLYDDVWKVRPRVKIGVQVVAALVLLSGGVGAHAMEPLVAPLVIRIENRLGPLPSEFHYVLAVGNWLLTITLVVGCCNATNLMDGLDGLCGGVTAVVAAGFVFLAVHMATYGTVDSTNDDGMRVVLGLALLGGVAGFVPFNFNPASIFMGDTGSMFMGFSCATLIATMAEKESRWFLAALIMFALPILDTALAFARRFVNRRPLFSADRHHIHHQLVNRGYTVKQTVVISYALAFGFVVLGGVIVFMRVRYAVAFYLVIFGSIIVAAYKMGMVHEKAAVLTPGRLGTGSTFEPPTADGVLELGTTGNVTGNGTGAPPAAGHPPA